MLWRIGEVVQILQFLRIFSRQAARSFEASPDEAIKNDSNTFTEFVAIENLDIFPGINILLFDVLRSGLNKFNLEQGQNTQSRNHIICTFSHTLECYPLATVLIFLSHPSVKLWKLRLYPSVCRSWAAQQAYCQWPQDVNAAVFWLCRKRQTVDSSLHMKFGTYENYHANKRWTCWLFDC